MQLNVVEMKKLILRNDHVNGSVNEDSDFCSLAREVCRHFADASRRMRIEDEADEVNPQSLHRLDVAGICHAANFYIFSVNHSVSFSCPMNACSAFPGSASFMNVSPIRKPRKPASRSRRRVSGEEIPLSETMTGRSWSVTLPAPVRPVSTPSAPAPVLPISAPLRLASIPGLTASTPSLPARAAASSKECATSVAKLPRCRLLIPTLSAISIEPADLSAVLSVSSAGWKWCSPACDAWPILEGYCRLAGAAWSFLERHFRLSGAA